MDVVNDEESLTGSIAPRTVSEEASPSIDTSAARFPLCVVWTPLPIISWLAPFVGHVGICRQDGVILDFAGPYFVNVDNFAFGAVARYVRLSREQVSLLRPSRSFSVSNKFLWDVGMQVKLSFLMLT
jgi:hypothetical protein